MVSSYLNRALMMTMMMMVMTVVMFFALFSGSSDDQLYVLIIIGGCVAATVVISAIVAVIIWRVKSTSRSSMVAPQDTSSSPESDKWAVSTRYDPSRPADAGRHSNGYRSNKCDVFATPHM